MSRTWRVRPLQPTGEDRQALLDFAATLDPASLAARFHGGLAGLAPPLVDRLMDVDHDRREAVLAEDAGGFLGIARYDADADPAHPGEAEVAVLVADGHRRRGIARALFADLAARAADHGVTCFVATVAPGNHRARGLVSALAPEAEADALPGDGGEIVYRIPVARLRQRHGV